MRNLLLLLFMGCYATISAQYLTGKSTIVFYDNNRSNRAISTELYYPSNTAGTGTPLASGTEKFPVVVFGHGFVMPTTAYTWLADSLVKNGYIVAFPSTESSFAPSHDNFGKDIAFLCSRISSLNDSSASFLFGRVSPKSAAAGHSMGGGASFLAMNANPNIAALFNFAAAETTPSAKAAALSVNRPSLIFSGSSDCIVAPAQQLEMYTNIPYACKTYININNALHCQFGNNDATCSFGQVTSGCNSSSITPAIVFEKVCNLLIPFLNFYLKRDCNAGTVYTSNYNSITGVSKQRICNTDPDGCVVTGTIDPLEQSGIQLFPNPVSSGNLHIRSLRGNLVSLRIEDLQGRLIMKRSFINSPDISLFISGKGVFIVSITTRTSLVRRNILVL